MNIDDFELLMLDVEENIHAAIEKWINDPKTETFLDGKETIKVNDINVIYDNSRRYGLFVNGYDLDLPVNCFGAYRDYLGGGVYGGIHANGREKENTLTLARTFVEELIKIENYLGKNHDPMNLESSEIYI